MTRVFEGVQQPKDMDEFTKSTLELIEQCGHSITMVGDDPPFAYTIGLCTRADHPYEMAIYARSPTWCGCC
jgi:hypothetical protein